MILLAFYWFFIMEVDAGCQWKRRPLLKLGPKRSEFRLESIENYFPISGMKEI
jgi:hypothetical protein